MNKNVKITYEEECRQLADGLEYVLKELRTTKRALWLARAERANEKSTGIPQYWRKLLNVDKWQWVERKCREKAEEYR